MRILLLGANGQVGWELQRSLTTIGSVNACDRTKADLEKLDVLTALLDDYQPDVIVNAAAYTAVDKAETDKDAAYTINSKAVDLIASKAKQFDAILVHYSTDYVFDGTQEGFYTESDQVNPQSVYGKSKLQGEQAIIKSGCKHLIFRTSWVYAARGLNFAKTIMRLANERDELKIVSDQFGVPTSAEFIADVTSICLHHIINNKWDADKYTGIYNLVPSGKTNWHSFARFVICKALKEGFTSRFSPDNIKAINSSEYPVAAKRPANSLLDTNKIQKTFGIYIPVWQTHVDRLVQELKHRGWE